MAKDIVIQPLLGKIDFQDDVGGSYVTNSNFLIADDGTTTLSLNKNNGGAIPTIDSVANVALDIDGSLAITDKFIQNGVHRPYDSAFFGVLREEGSNGDKRAYYEGGMLGVGDFSSSAPIAALDVIGSIHASGDITSVNVNFTGELQDNGTKVELEKLDFFDKPSDTVTTTHNLQAADITATGAVIVQGNLTVEGTTTTIESSTLAIDDKNIVLGRSDDSTNDASAQGGGLTLSNDANGDKTIAWSATGSNHISAWEFSETVVVAGDVDFTGALKKNGVAIDFASESGVIWSEIPGEAIDLTSATQTAYGSSGQLELNSTQIKSGTSATDNISDLANITISGDFEITLTPNVAETMGSSAAVNFLFVSESLGVPTSGGGGVYPNFGTLVHIGHYPSENRSRIYNLATENWPVNSLSYRIIYTSSSRVLVVLDDGGNLIIQTTMPGTGGILFGVQGYNVDQHTNGLVATYSGFIGAASIDTATYTGDVSTTGNIKLGGDLLNSATGGNYVDERINVKNDGSDAYLAGKLSIGSSANATNNDNYDLSVLGSLNYGTLHADGNQIDYGTDFGQWSLSGSSLTTASGNNLGLGGAANASYKLKVTGDSHVTGSLYYGASATLIEDFIVTSKTSAINYLIKDGSDNLSYSDGDLTIDSTISADTVTASNIDFTSSLQKNGSALTLKSGDFGVWESAGASVSLPVPATQGIDISSFITSAGNTKVFGVTNSGFYFLANDNLYLYNFSTGSVSTIQQNLENTIDGDGATTTYGVNTHESIIKTVSSGDEYFAWSNRQTSKFYVYNITNGFTQLNDSTVNFSSLGLTNDVHIKQLIPDPSGTEWNDFALHSYSEDAIKHANKKWTINYSTDLIDDLIGLDSTGRLFYSTSSGSLAYVDVSSLSNDQVVNLDDLSPVTVTTLFSSYTDSNGRFQITSQIIESSGSPQTILTDTSDNFCHLYDLLTGDVVTDLIDGIFDVGNGLEPIGGSNYSFVAYNPSNDETAWMGNSKHVYTTGAIIGGQVIHSQASVAIGKTAPDYALDVVGDINIEGGKLYQDGAEVVTGTLATINFLQMIGDEAASTEFLYTDAPFQIGQRDASSSHATSATFTSGVLLEVDGHIEAANNILAAGAIFTNSITTGGLDTGSGNIVTTGQVAIGDGATTGTYGLEIQDGLNVKGGFYNNGGSALKVEALDFWVNSGDNSEKLSTRSATDNITKVGIGVADPTSALEVSGDINIVSGSLLIDGTALVVDPYFNVNEDGHLTLLAKDNGEDPNTGRSLSVGSTDTNSVPSATLDVTGDILASGDITFNGNLKNGNNTLTIAALDYWTEGSGNLTRGSGDVIISSGDLSVSGNVDIGAGGQFLRDGTPIDFNAEGGSLWTLGTNNDLTSGASKVGIGTGSTTPLSEQLEVDGNIKFTGDLKQVVDGVTTTVDLLNVWSSSGETFTYNLLTGDNSTVFEAYSSATDPSYSANVITHSGTLQIQSILPVTEMSLDYRVTQSIQGTHLGYKWRVNVIENGVVDAQNSFYLNISSHTVSPEIFTRLDFVSTVNGVGGYSEHPGSSPYLNDSAVFNYDGAGNFTFGKSSSQVTKSIPEWAGKTLQIIFDGSSNLSSGGVNCGAKQLTFDSGTLVVTTGALTATFEGSVSAEGGLTIGGDISGAGITGTGLTLGAGNITTTGTIGSGAITSSGLLSGVGAELGGGNITNAGTISSGQITSTGSLSGTSLSLADGGITNTGAIIGATTIVASSSIEGGSLDISGVAEVGSLTTTGSIAGGALSGTGLTLTNGNISDVTNITAGGFVKATGALEGATLALTNASIVSDGSITATSLDLNDGGIVDAGAISGSSLALGSGSIGSGAITSTGTVQGTSLVASAGGVQATGNIISSAGNVEGVDVTASGTLGGSILNVDTINLSGAFSQNNQVIDFTHVWNTEIVDAAGASGGVQSESFDLDEHFIDIEEPNHMGVIKYGESTTTYVQRVNAGTQNTHDNFTVKSGIFMSELDTTVTILQVGQMNTNPVITFTGSIYIYDSLTDEVIGRVESGRYSSSTSGGHYQWWANVWTYDGGVETEHVHADTGSSFAEGIGFVVVSETGAITLGNYTHISPDLIGKSFCIRLSIHDKAWRYTFGGSRTYKGATVTQIRADKSVVIDGSLTVGDTASQTYGFGTDGTLNISTLKVDNTSVDLSSITGDSTASQENINYWEIDGGAISYYDGDVSIGGTDPADSTLKSRSLTVTNDLGVTNKATVGSLNVPVGGTPTDITFGESDLSKANINYWTDDSSTLSTPRNIDVSGNATVDGNLVLEGAGNIDFNHADNSYEIRVTPHATAPVFEIWSDIDSGYLLRSGNGQDVVINRNLDATDIAASGALSGATLSVNGTAITFDVPNDEVNQANLNYLTLSGSDLTYTGGSLGIGTSSPDSALEVVGDIELSGSFKRSGAVLELENHWGTSPQGSGLPIDSNVFLPGGDLGQTEGNGNFLVNGLGNDASTLLWLRTGTNQYVLYTVNNQGQASTNGGVLTFQNTPNLIDATEYIRHDGGTNAYTRSDFYPGGLGNFVFMLDNTNRTIQTHFIGWLPRIDTQPHLESQLSIGPTNSGLRQWRAFLDGAHASNDSSRSLTTSQSNSDWNRIEAASAYHRVYLSNNNTAGEGSDSGVYSWKINPKQHGDLSSAASMYSQNAVLFPWQNVTESYADADSTFDYDTDGSVVQVVQLNNIVNTLYDGMDEGDKASVKILDMAFDDTNDIAVFLTNKGLFKADINPSTGLLSNEQSFLLFSAITGVNTNSGVVGDPFADTRISIDPSKREVYWADRNAKAIFRAGYSSEDNNSYDIVHQWTNSDSWNDTHLISGDLIVLDTDTDYKTSYITGMTSIVGGAPHVYYADTVSIGKTSKPDSTLDVDGSATIKNSITSTLGNITATAGGLVGQSLTVGGDSVTFENSTVNKVNYNYLVDASTKYTLNNPLEITGALTGVTDLTIGGAISGATNVTASGTLSVGGAALGSNALAVTGDVHISGDISATNATFTDINIAGISTTIETSDLDVTDNVIRVASGVTDTLVNNTGILFGGNASDAVGSGELESLLYLTSTSGFNLSTDLVVSGALSANSLDLNDGGITSAGAIADATSITATGAISGAKGTFTAVDATSGLIETLGNIEGADITASGALSAASLSVTGLDFSKMDLWTLDGGGNLTRATGNVEIGGGNLIVDGNITAATASTISAGSATLTINNITLGENITKDGTPIDLYNVWDTVSAPAEVPLDLTALSDNIYNSAITVTSTTIVSNASANDGNWYVSGVFNEDFTITFTATGDTVPATGWGPRIAFANGGLSSFVDHNGYLDLSTDFNAGFLFNHQTGSNPNDTTIPIYFFSSSAVAELEDSDTITLSFVASTNVVSLLDNENNVVFSGTLANGDGSFKFAVQMTEEDHFINYSGTTVNPNAGSIATFTNKVALGASSYSASYTGAIDDSSGSYSAILNVTADEDSGDYFRVSDDGDVYFSGDLIKDGTVLDLTAVSGDVALNQAQINYWTLGGSSSLTYNAGAINTNQALTAGSISTGGTLGVTGKATVGSLNVGGSDITFTETVIDKPTLNYWSDDETTLSTTRSASVTGSLSSASLTVTNAIGAASMTLSGAANVQSLTATGNITGQTIDSNGAITGTGLTVGSGGVTINSGGDLSVAGDITSVTGITATGNIGAVGITASADIGADNIVATGDVTGANLITGGNLTATGNISGANLTIANVNVIGELSKNGVVQNLSHTWGIDPAYPIADITTLSDTTYDSSYWSVTSTTTGTSLSYLQANNPNGNAGAAYLNNVYTYMPGGSDFDITISRPLNTNGDPVTLSMGFGVPLDITSNDFFHYSSGMVDGSKYGVGALTWAGSNGHFSWRSWGNTNTFSDISFYMDDASNSVLRIKYDLSDNKVQFIDATTGTVIQEYNSPPGMGNSTNGWALSLWVNASGDNPITLDLGGLMADAESDGLNTATYTGNAVLTNDLTANNISGVDITGTGALAIGSTGQLSVDATGAIVSVGAITSSGLISTTNGITATGDIAGANVNIATGGELTVGGSAISLEPNVWDKVSDIAVYSDNVALGATSYDSGYTQTEALSVTGNTKIDGNLEFTGSLVDGSGATVDTTSTFVEVIEEGSVFLPVGKKLGVGKAYTEGAEATAGFDTSNILEITGEAAISGDFKVGSLVDDSETIKLSADGAITATSFTSSGAITTTGDISGANITASGNVTGVVDLTASGDITASSGTLGINNITLGGDITKDGTAIDLFNTWDKIIVPAFEDYPNTGGDDGFFTDDNYPDSSFTVSIISTDPNQWSIYRGSGPANVGAWHTSSLDSGIEFEFRMNNECRYALVLDGDDVADASIFRHEDHIFGFRVEGDEWSDHEVNIHSYGTLVLNAHKPAIGNDEYERLKYKLTYDYVTGDASLHESIDNGAYSLLHTQAIGSGLNLKVAGTSTKSYAYTYIDKLQKIIVGGGTTIAHIDEGKIAIGASTYDAASYTQTETLAVTGAITSTGSITGGSLVSGGDVTIAAGSNLIVGSSAIDFSLLDNSIDQINHWVKTGTDYILGSVSSTVNAGINLDSLGDVHALEINGSLKASGDIVTDADLEVVHISATGDMGIGGDVVSSTGNIAATAGNVTAGGYITATGDVTGANLTTTGDLTVDNVVLGGNITKDGTAIDLYNVWDKLVVPETEDISASNVIVYKDGSEVSGLTHNFTPTVGNTIGIGTSVSNGKPVFDNQSFSLTIDANISADDWYNINITTESTVGNQSQGLWIGGWGDSAGNKITISWNHLDSSTGDITTAHNGSDGVITLSWNNDTGVMTFDFVHDSDSSKDVNFVFDDNPVQSGAVLGVSFAGGTHVGMSTTIDSITYGGSFTNPNSGEIATHADKIALGDKTPGAYDAGYTQDEALKVTGDANISGITTLGNNLRLEGNDLVIDGDIVNTSGVKLVDSDNAATGGVNPADINYLSSDGTNLSYAGGNLGIGYASPGVVPSSFSINTNQHVQAQGGFYSSGFFKLDAYSLGNNTLDDISHYTEVYTPLTHSNGAQFLHNVGIKTTPSTQYDLNIAGDLNWNGKLYQGGEEYKALQAGDQLELQAEGVGTGVNYTVLNLQKNKFQFVDDTTSGLSYANGSVDAATVAAITITDQAIGLETDGQVIASDVIAGNQQSTSDERLKQDITQITNAVDKTLQLTGITFQWNVEKINEEGLRVPGVVEDRTEVGLVAQQVEQVLPEVVTEVQFGYSNVNEDTVYKTINYDKVVALLVEAIKEQQEQINDLKQAVEDLKK